MAIHVEKNSSRCAINNEGGTLQLWLGASVQLNVHFQTRYRFHLQASQLEHVCEDLA
jgi:hypothetical protein